MNIKISSGAILVPADEATAKQLLAHGGVEVTNVTETVQEVKPTKSKKKIVTE